MKSIKSVGVKGDQIFLTLIDGSSSYRKEYEGDFYSFILDMFQGKFIPLESANGGKWLFILRCWAGEYPKENNQQFRDNIDELLEMKPEGSKWLVQMSDGAWCKNKKMNGLILSRNKKDAKVFNWYRAMVIAVSYNGEIHKGE